MWIGLFRFIANDCGERSDVDLRVVQQGHCRSDGFRLDRRQVALQIDDRVYFLFWINAL